MKQIEKTITPFIASQFPSFYREEGENFIAFLEAYYEWLESSDNVLWKTRRLTDYRDIDNTLDEFLIYFKEKYLKNIQFAPIATNKKLLIKNSLSLYRSKGSERSIDLFFKLVYGTDAEIRYPTENILRASDGVWSAPEYLEISYSKHNVNYVGKQIIGAVSNAKAFVEKYIRRKVSVGTVNILYISNREGDFLKGEAIGLNVNNVPVFEPEKNARIIGSIGDYTIIERGKDFKVGDILDFSSSKRGLGGKVRVSATRKSSAAIDFQLIDGGYGYSLNAIPIISEKAFTIINVATISTQTNNYFNLFESIIEPVIEMDYSAASNTVAVGALIYRYDASNNVVAVGKVLSGTADDSNSGSFILSHVNGVFTNADTYYTTSNAASFSSNNVAGRVYIATVMGLSSNVSVKVNNGNSNIQFVETQTVQQLSNAAIEGIGKLSLITTTADANVFVFNVTNVNGMFKTSANVYVSDNTAITANVINTDYVVGVYDIKRSNVIINYTSANNNKFLLSPYVYQYNEASDQIAKALVLTADFTSNTGNLFISVVNGNIDPTKKIYTESNTAEANVNSYLVKELGGDFIVSDYARVLGLTSQSSGYLSVSSTGVSANFDIGGITETEFVALNTDIIGSNNAGFVDYRRKVLDVSSITGFANNNIVSQDINKIAFNPATSMNLASGFFTLPSANSRFAVGDHVKYLVDSGNTAINGIANDIFYYVYSANSTGLILSFAHRKTVPINNTNFTYFGNNAVSESGHYFYIPAYATIHQTNSTSAVVKDIFNNFGVTAAGANVTTYGNGNLVLVSNNLVNTAITSINSYAATVVSPKPFLNLFIRENGFGFIKKTVGYSVDELQSCLSHTIKEIGIISYIDNELSGTNYSNNPFVLVDEPLISALNFRDFAIGIANASSLFITGEKITQSTVTPDSFLLKVDGDVYGNVYSEVSTTVDVYSEINNSNDSVLFKSSLLNFNATANVDNLRNFIIIPNNQYAVGDYFRYIVNSGNTAVSGLANNSFYFVTAANSTGIAAVSATSNGANIAISSSNAATFNSMSSVNSVSNFISIASANTSFANTNKVRYYTTEGISELEGLTNNAIYFVRYANSTGLALSETVAGSNVDITAASAGSNGHFLKYYDADANGHFLQFYGNQFANTNKILYSTGFGNTAISGLANNTIYYAVNANSISFSLALTPGGSKIAIANGATSENGHFFSTVPGYQVADLVYLTIIRTFDPNTAVSSNFITITNNSYVNGDVVIYYVDTPTVPIITEQAYYAVNANSSGTKLSLTANGSPITITPTASPESGHNLKSIANGTVNFVYVSSGNNYYVKIANVINTPANTFILMSYNNPYVDSTVLMVEPVTDELEAKGIIKIGSDDELIYVKRITLDNNFTVGARITGQLSGTTANITSVTEDFSVKLPVGLNANIIANTSLSNGQIDAVQILDSGFGYTNGEIIDIIAADGNEAQIKIETIGQGKSRGAYTSSRGFLNSDMYIHDGDYYQEYSYEIFSKLSLDRYAEMFKTVMHTAGTKFFGSVVNVEENEVPVEYSQHATEEQWSFNANSDINSSNDSISILNRLYIRSFNANTSVNATTDFISLPNNPFANGAYIKYSIDSGNTANIGFTNGNYYYAVNANSSGIKLSTTSGGSNVDITKGATEWGHNLTSYENPFVDGDLVLYVVATGNTVLSGLTNGNSYYVVNATPISLKLSATANGSPINITASSTSETGHTLTKTTEES